MVRIAEGFIVSPFEIVIYKKICMGTQRAYGVDTPVSSAQDAQFGARTAVESQRGGGAVALSGCFSGKTALFWNAVIRRHASGRGFRSKVSEIQLNPYGCQARQRSGICYGRAKTRGINSKMYRLDCCIAGIVGSNAMPGIIALASSVSMGEIRIFYGTLTGGETRSNFRDFDLFVLIRLKRN
jgi:hypothetical protein